MRGSVDVKMGLLLKLERFFFMKQVFHSASEYTEEVQQKSVKEFTDIYDLTMRCGG